MSSFWNWLSNFFRWNRQPSNMPQTTREINRIARTGRAINSWSPQGTRTRFNINAIARDAMQPKRVRNQVLYASKKMRLPKPLQPVEPPKPTTPKPGPYYAKSRTSVKPYVFSRIMG